MPAIKQWHSFVWRRVIYRFEITKYKVKVCCMYGTAFDDHLSRWNQLWAVFKVRWKSGAACFNWQTFQRLLSWLVFSLLLKIYILIQHNAGNRFCFFHEILFYWSRFWVWWLICGCHGVLRPRSRLVNGHHGNTVFLYTSKDITSVEEYQSKHPEKYHQKAWIL